MRYNRILLAIAAIGLISCAKEYTPVKIEVEKPENIAQYEYLNAYGPLKEYLAAGSSFKLGGGFSLADLQRGELVYAAAVSNFNEWVAGNEMKYASVVNDEGVINPTGVMNFVNLAKEAGVGLYGHTLVWHSQQRPRYLNKIIQYPSDPTWAPVSEQNFETDDMSNFPYNDGAVISYVEGVDGGRALKITNESVKPQNYNCQAAILFPLAEAGIEYRLKMKIRADVANSVGSQYHGPAFSNYIQGGPNIDFTTQWTDYERAFTPPVHSSGAIAIAVTFEMGSTATSYYFDDIVIERFYPEGLGGGPAGDGGHAMKLSNDEEKTNAWDIQIAYDFAQTLTQNVTYTLKFAAKADKNVNLPFVIQSASYGSQLNATVPIGTSWAEHTATFTPAANDDIQFRINMGRVLATIFIDNLTFTAEGSSESLIPGGDFENGIAGWTGWGWSQGKPSVLSHSADGEGYVASTSSFLPKEERLEILTGELDRWISAMMTATGADADAGTGTYVKAWDLVNEPMDDGAPFELKTGDADGDGTPDDKDDPNFYWQDHMGKDYARVAAKLARQYAGGDVKLFVNDYNLEAVYNNNDKARGLIQMVEYWESDGVTKIDGLGTQMHISYNMNAEAQRKQEEAIVTMFELLAATGKLVKVTELDMGINDQDGASINTGNVTLEQHKAMADFYEFIVKKYFEIVPAAQQYGITHWSPADSPASGSGWRVNSPIGLWSNGWSRKPAYAGFAKGLGAQ